MSKIIITIIDLEDGRVHCRSNPTFAEMMEQRSRVGMTAAEGYALCALNAVREAGVSKNPFKEYFSTLFKRAARCCKKNINRNAR